MRIAVTGAAGQLGAELCSQLRRRGHELAAFSHSELDVCDIGNVFGTLGAFEPEAVAYCAAYTDVDGAERERERCMAVNAEGAENVARLCAAVGAKMLYPSTDFIFSGEGDIPWRVEDKPQPLNVYGESKLKGERAVLSALPRSFIVRTAWIFSAGGRNFVRSILNAARADKPLRVVDDQIGSPTYVPALAALMADMLESERYGVYHAVSSGPYVSRFELAREIINVAGMEREITAISSAELGAAARRPLNSRMDTGSLSEAGFAQLPDWREGIKYAVAALMEENNV